MTDPLPTAVIGAGPVGLAAAAHLAGRNEPFLLLERGSAVGHAVSQWSHVRVFSPWRFNIDKEARRILEESGWQAPAESELPTGEELVDRYLKPLSEHPAISGSLRFNAQVVAIGRKHLDKVRTVGRESQPFEIRLASGERIAAKAVIDASGTWFSPNPIGSDGHFAAGEGENGARISYGVPDVLGRDRARFADKRVLVVGAGHSAINSILDLAELRRLQPRTRLQWAMRRENLASVFGGESADALPARGALGSKARAVIEAGEAEVLTPFHIFEVARAGDAVRVSGELAGQPYSTVADEIIVAAGFRPDFSGLREVRVKLDPWLEAADALAPMIDPNEHSCGTVRPHGHAELSHPERDFYIVGMKSYGRAPTFLMATGYEQVRSVVAALAGDLDAAGRVELELPETGVCNAGAATGSPAEVEAGDGGCCGEPRRTATTSHQQARSKDDAAIQKGEMNMATKQEAEETAGCCGGPAPTGIDACCVKDAEAKAAGEVGCGCAAGAEPEPVEQEPAQGCCG